ncbi:hypothetical protein LCGC14_1789510 [marine sediment metagenome]|uniref:Helix-turn-helix domain-containing protein n=1 Tax=marine sediment metagenome TaxID=412755 RepID=A0A0F9HFJ7_9ZZZZ
MVRPGKQLRMDEIREGLKAFAPIVSPKQLAEIVGVGRSTIYDWIAKGRLDGTFRRRGKHQLIWLSRAIDLLFNGSDWRGDEGEK